YCYRRSTTPGCALPIFIPTCLMNACIAILTLNDRPGISIKCVPAIRTSVLTFSRSYTKNNYVVFLIFINDAE
ncbi:hypothetical protein L0244_29630, partial [bacterium]|nr:hypothetical protein [bacterium]